MSSLTCLRRTNHVAAPIRYFLNCTNKYNAVTIHLFERSHRRRTLIYASSMRLCTTKSSSSNISAKEEEFRLVYEGPLTKKIKYLKVFSLSTACLSLAAPVVFFMGNSTLAPIAKAILSSTVVVMGVTTTSLLHWLTRVYVYRMFFHPQTRTFAAETSTIFGTTKKETFSVEDIHIPEIESGFSTFEAKGRKYFIHVDLKEADQILKYVREYNLETL